MIHLKQYHSEDFINNPSLFNTMFKFSKREFETHELRSCENMDVTDWENKRHTLLFTIMIEQRFSKSKGILSIVYDDDEIVSLSGAYRADFAPTEILLCGTRTHTIKSHRRQLLHFDYVFPAQFQYGRDHGFKECWLTFNTYRKNLMIALERGMGLGFDFGAKFKETFADVEYLDGTYDIKDVPQHIAVKRLDLNYRFDYQSLAC